MIKGAQNALLYPVILYLDIENNSDYWERYVRYDHPKILIIIEKLPVWRARVSTKCEIFNSTFAYY